MTAPPAWLPPIMSVDGEYHAVIERLYEVFARDFKVARPRLGPCQVWWVRRVLPGERYEEGFWHLITRKDTKTGDRLHDPRRAERLPWCSPTIIHCTDPAVRLWDYVEASGRITTYVWLEEFDYVVLLEKKGMRLGQVAFLITAYHLDGEWMRQSLRKKYAKRCH